MSDSENLQPIRELYVHDVIRKAGDWPAANQHVGHARYRRSDPGLLGDSHDGRIHRIEKVAAETLMLRLVPAR